MFPLINYIKSCNKKMDVFLQSVAWMIISVVSAYPNFCLKFDISMFTITNRDDYCYQFLLPIMLFLLAFMFDFFFSIKDLNIGQKRGDLFKIFTLLLCLMMFFLCLLTIVPNIDWKIFLFIILWMNISLIKGLTVLIPGEDELVMLKTPINNLKRSRK